MIEVRNGRGRIIYAVASLMPFAPGWSTTRGGRSAAVIRIAASFVFLAPLYRSLSLAAGLPKSMEAAFGPSERSSTPLSFKNLLMGVQHYFLNMPRATHGCDYNFNGPCGRISTYAVERFLAFAAPAR